MDNATFLKMIVIKDERDQSVPSSDELEKLQKCENSHTDTQATQMELIINILRYQMRGMGDCHLSRALYVY